MSSPLTTLQRWGKAIAPIATATFLALLPSPAGLPQHAWYFFAIFAGVVVGLMFEPLPGGAIGLLGVTLVTLLASRVFYSPEELARPGFNTPNAALARLSHQDRGEGRF